MAPSAKAPVTVERTTKDDKATQAIGAILIVLGLLGACGAASATSTGGIAASVSVLVIGLVVYIAGRVGAWWSTG